MQINLLGGSNKSRYPEISSQRTINWLPTVYSQEEGLDVQISLLRGPGLSMFCNIPGRYSRGIFTARTVNFVRSFCVVDQTLWELNGNMSATNRGVMSNLAFAASKVFLLVNGDEQLFIGGTNAGYCFNMTTNTLTQITDPNYPPTIISATYNDGFLFVVAGPGSDTQGFAHFSNADDITTWSGQNVYHTTIRAAAIKAVAAHRDKVFNFTAETIEPYYEDGGVEVWARFPAGIANTGLYATNTEVAYDGGLIFVGMSDVGAKHVYTLANEYSATTSISESDVDVQWAINSTPQALDGAWAYMQHTRDGHMLYRLFCPQLKTTFCYDTNTAVWFEQQSMSPALDVDGSYRPGMFRGKFMAIFQDYVLFQDMYSGAIFFEDYNNLTENGTLIRRQRTSTNYKESYSNIGIHIMELDTTKGVGTVSGQGKNPLMMVSMSWNGGHTYTVPRFMPLGNQGDYYYRARLNKLGTARQWSIEMVVTDPIDIMIQNAWAHGVVSAN